MQNEGFNPFNFFRRRLPREERSVVYKEVVDGSQPVRRYWVLITLSTMIAAYGLLANSVAVIIGAMLVAPLMGPIFGIALGIVSGNNILLRKSLMAELLGIVITIFIAYLLGILPLNLGLSAEMQARTAPTLYDLIIALASGFAGAYAIIQPKVNSALPGIAISVALLPPLATCGLCLALNEYSLALGALLLFLANFFAIQIATGLVLLHYGFGSTGMETSKGAHRVLLHLLPSILATLAMATFMTQTLSNIVNDRQLETEITSVLSEEISQRTGGVLQEIAERQQVGNVYEVIAVALTPEPFTPSQVEKIEAKLREKVRDDIYLVVRSLISRDSDKNGQVFRTPEEVYEDTTSAYQSEVLTKAKRTVTKALDNIPGASLESLVRNETNGQSAFIATVATPNAITPTQVASIEQKLSEQLDKQTRLILRSVITRDADANRFIYDPIAEMAPQLSAEEIALQNRIRNVIKRRLENLEGATLTEFKVRSSDKVVNVQAVVHAPAPVQPSAVAEIEDDLKEFVHPNTILTVQTIVSGVATARGWQTDNAPASAEIPSIIESP